MRSLVVLALLALVVAPALSVEGPTPGTYTTLNGDFSEGVFSESWVDPPCNDGVVNNTIHAWDNGGGVEWEVYCPSLLQVVIVLDIRDANGNGFVKYSTDYAGGRLWLSQSGPWEYNEIDFTATISMFNVTSSHQYAGGNIVNIVSDILF